MSLITRTEKGSKLTIAEMDGNLIYLDNKMPYKVYTALLTQNGGNNVLTLFSGDSLTIGVTYTIKGYAANDDFSNVGGPPPVNETEYWSDYSFVATGTTPAVWTDTSLDYNTGAPVVTVLENTIGNIWFTYNSDGFYSINSNELFTNNKSVIFITNTTGDINSPSEIVKAATYDLSSMYIASFSTGAPPNSNNILYKTPIEIRVYN